MTLPARAASRGVSAERWHGDLLRFVQDTATVADMEEPQASPRPSRVAYPRRPSRCCGCDRGDAPAVRWFARVNPLSYQTDLLRTLMLRGATSTFGLPVDFAVLIGSLVVLVTIAARIYPRVVL